MKIGKKWFAALALSLSVGVLLTACGGGSSSSGADKTYIVGTEAAYPPFEMLEGDKITGFDIDVIKAVAEAAGLKIDIRNYAWDPLFDGVDKGTIDIAISSVTITDERKQKYDFSDPYFEANQLIIVPQDSPVSKLADLKGKRISVQGATTGEIAVRKAFGDNYEGLKRYEDLPSAVDELFNGRVDAAVGDNGPIAYLANKIKDKKFKLIKDDSFEKEYIGIMIKKGNPDLINKINQGLKTIKDNGKLEQIRSQYFGKQ